ncbi:MAG: hypothetical protein WC489_00145 [Patescibacteria group bacterium]
MKKYLIISGAALVCIVILVILVQSLLFRKSGGSSSSPIPTPVSGGRVSRTTGKTEDTSFRFQSSSSRASDSGASQSSTSSKNQETARRQMDAVKKLLPVLEKPGYEDSSLVSQSNTTGQETGTQTLSSIETDDFILAYSPNLDRLVVTRKTPQADEAFAQWALSQGYPALVDNYQTTIVSDKTMEEVQTPYVTKSPEETMTGMLNLFSALFRTPSFPKETPVPPSPTPKVESSSSVSSSSSRESTQCSDLDAKLARYDVFYPDGYTGIPRINNQILNFARDNHYSIPYRNPNCTVTEPVIRKVYEKMRPFYPSYWGKTQLLDHWRIVQEKAKKYNFNPLFVISLWIEESAAGGATQATQFGCDYLRNADGSWTKLKGAPSNICDQMQCLFVVGSANPKDYLEFSCSYQFGFSQCVPSDAVRCQTCKKTPSFIRTINFWYEFMSEGQPDACRAKYCPGITGCP